MTMAPWFRSLRVPGTETRCCDIADCRNYPVRPDGSNYQVFFDDRWLTVPTEVVSDRWTIPPVTMSPASNAIIGPMVSPTALVCSACSGATNVMRERFVLAPRETTSPASCPPHSRVGAVLLSQARRLISLPEYLPMA